MEARTRSHAGAWCARALLKGTTYSAEPWRPELSLQLARVHVLHCTAQAADCVQLRAHWSTKVGRYRRCRWSPRPDHGPGCGSALSDDSYGGFLVRSAQLVGGQGIERGRCSFARLLIPFVGCKKRRIWARSLGNTGDSAGNRPPRVRDPFASVAGALRSAWLSPLKDNPCTRAGWCACSLSRVSAHAVRDSRWQRPVVTLPHINLSRVQMRTHSRPHITVNLA